MTYQSFENVFDVVVARDCTSLQLEQLQKRIKNTGNGSVSTLQIVT
ncbi:MAG: hypothetical protein WCE99_06980 [Nitrososphaeraceae archaeon]